MLFRIIVEESLSKIGVSNKDVTNNSRRSVDAQGCSTIESEHMEERPQHHKSIKSFGFDYKVHYNRTILAIISRNVATLISDHALYHKNIPQFKDLSNEMAFTIYEAEQQVSYYIFIEMIALTVNLH